MYLPTLVRIRKICRIRKVEMYSKPLICVQRLCRFVIIPDYTGVGLGRYDTYHLTILMGILPSRLPPLYLLPFYLLTSDSSHFAYGPY